MTPLFSRTRHYRVADLADADGADDVSPFDDDAVTLDDETAAEADGSSTLRRAALLAAGLGALAAARAALRRWRTFDFRGRTVMITGGSRGLGLLIAREFVAEGARIAICARDQRELARARAQLVALGADVMAAPCDITDRDDVEAFVQAACNEFGEVDVLVNNAGAIQVGPVDTMTVEDFETEMRTHFWGPLHATMAVLPGMKRRRNGRIVNIASVGGKVAIPHLVPYSASKFALVGLSTGLRAELVKSGVLVTTVCPGLLRTGSARHAIVKGDHAAEYAWFSIADSLPGASSSAERAAARIVEACRYGEAEVVIGLPARALTKAYALAPNLTAEALAVADRLLPKTGPDGYQAREGAEINSRWTPSPLTTLGDRAAARNNELG